MKFFLLTGFIAVSVLFASASFGQTYYSRFDNPVYGVNYVVSNPSGTSCPAPPIQNTVGYVDKDNDTYAYFKDSLTQPYQCDINYTFDALLNIPPDSPYLSPGSQAGWRIKVPSGISAQELGKYLIVSTYLNGVPQEYSTGNLLLGLDLSDNGINWFVYFITSKPYNTLELVVNPNIAPLNTNFEFDVYYAIGATSVILPAQIDNFKATVLGRSVNLSWESLTETNVASYRIERSNNGGASYSTVASIPAKGNSTAVSTYGYTDNVSLDGNYLYRIVTVNLDGSSKATSSIAAIISGQGKLILYPSVVKSGQNVTVKTTETGFVTVHLYDSQGRLVKQQRLNSTGQFTISTTGLSTGVYNVKMISATGNALQTKIIVN